MTFFRLILKSLFERKKQKLIFLATTLSLFSCSQISQQRVSRSPSSIQTLGTQATVDQLIRAEDPRGEAEAYVARLLRLQLRGHGWLYEMDHIFKNAEEPLDLLEQKAYRRLLVLRNMAEEMEDKIVDLYSGARQASLTGNEDGSRSEQADRALLVVAGIRDAVRLALKDSASKALLHNLIQKMGDSIRNGDWRRGVLDIDTDVLTSFGDLKVTDVKTKILERLSALPEEDEVMAEVDRAEAQFADELKKIDRSPNSVKIFPSSGPAGNIDGTSFPKGTWALTFDDGPHASITSRDIENLKSAGVKATFFWLAKNLRPNLDVVREAISEGMPVANHSWTHAKLDSSADLERLKTNLDREIVLSTSEHTRVLGAAPLFFRCPYGAGFRDPKIRAMIAKLGMIHVRWNVDSLDWKDPDPESVQERVELQMKNNRAGIILFHDIQSPALKVVPNLLDKYRGKVRWVTIPQIVDELNGKARR